MLRAANMIMKKIHICFLGAILTALTLFAAGCSQPGEASVPAGSSLSTQGAGSASGQVASSREMAPASEVVEEGMVPISGKQLRDGTYPIQVDSSSSMFRVVDCQLTVEDGAMTAVMTMSGTGYRYVYLGTGEEAVQSSEAEYIPYTEAEDGSHRFTIPVEALDAGVPCAAFSARKELWYDRTLLFRADSLPLEAWQDGVIPTAASLGLEDGTYQVQVELQGGSGRASVVSPTQLVVADGQASALLTWNSSNYDYMKVNGVQYDVTMVENCSTFSIPVPCFDWSIPVIADTVAMSVPHEVEYTLRFDSSSLTREGP